MRAQVDANKQVTQRRWDSGFGIPEAVLALVILTTALLGLAATAMHAGDGIKAAHLRTAAMDQARIQLEELLARPYDSLTAGESVAGRVRMEWTVTNRSRTKEIVFVYRYDVRGRTRVDTLAAALRRS